MKSKKLRAKVQLLSTPFGVYVFAIVCSVIFLYSSQILTSCNEACACKLWWSNFFLNIGYGTIASIVVTLLVDIGNTFRQKRSDKRIFTRITMELRNACENLPSEMYIAVYDCYGYNDNQKRTFDQWSEQLFKQKSNDEEQQKRQIGYVVQEISTIKKTALNLKSELKFFYQNSFVDEEYQKKLENLIRQCGRIEHFFKRADYIKCYDVIVGTLKSSILEQFTDLTLDYTRVYNEEEYM